MSAADDLRAARALIEDPEHWTKGRFARDADGMTVNVVSDEACRWCASGALFAVGASDSAHDALHRAAEPLATAVRLNDDLDHAAVLAMYDRAIELAEADQ